MIPYEAQVKLMKAINGKRGTIYIKDMAALERFEEKYPYFMATKKSKYPYGCEYVEPSGTIWNVVKASDYARGYKPAKVIIDENIDYDIYNCVITPCLIACSSAEFF